MKVLTATKVLTSQSAQEQRQPGKPISLPNPGSHRIAFSKAQKPEKAR